MKKCRRRLLAWSVATLALIAWPACDDENDSPPAGEVGVDSSPGDAGASDLAELPDGAPLDASSADGAGNDALGDPSVDGDTAPAVVTEPGPYHVGYREEWFSYEPGIVPGTRQLRLALWYPTLESGGPTRYQSFLLRPDVVTEAEVAPGGRLPVLVFSHGSNGMAEQSYDLTEFFASHGWLVAAPDHTGNTFRDLGTEMSPDLIFLRPTDVSAVLDHLENLPGDHPLAGRSGDDVVVAGHSFGGYTTLAVAGAELAGVEDALAECEAGTLPDYVCDALTEERVELARDGFLDPRVDLAVPIAPGAGVVFAEGVADIDIPVLLITGKADATTTNASEGDPIWAALDGPDDLRVDIERAGHFSFTSVCDVFPSEFFGDGCGDDYIDRDTLFTIVNAYSLAFSRYHLWGDDSVSDLLEGRETLADEVELSHGAE